MSRVSPFAVVGVVAAAVTLPVFLWSQGPTSAGPATGVVPESTTLPTPTPGTCYGPVATILGTGDPDFLVGTTGADVIAGLSGNDLIIAGPGDDLVCADFGEDVVYGGGGNDRLYGLIGNDVVIGGVGDDYVDGHTGADLLIGGPGNDLMDGTPDQGCCTDVCLGGTGDDAYHNCEEPFDPEGVPTRLLCITPGSPVTPPGTGILLQLIYQQGIPYVLPDREIHWTDEPGLGEIVTSPTLTDFSGYSTASYGLPFDLGQEGDETVTATFPGDARFASSSCEMTFHAVSEGLPQPTPTPTPTPTAGP